MCTAIPTGALGRAVPSGVYDITVNGGRICSGTSGNTPACVVDTISTWCQADGRAAYPRPSKHLLLAATNVRHGARRHGWHDDLQRPGDASRVAARRLSEPPEDHRCQDGHPSRRTTRTAFSLDVLETTTGSSSGVLIDKGPAPDSSGFPQARLRRRSGRGLRLGRRQYRGSASRSHPRRAL